MYAVDLINKRQYKYAKELIDMILYTNYQVLDDNGGDDFEISLYELKKNNLININIDVLCSYAIYATYQYSNESSRAKNIYECFKNENFRGISIEDSFKLGIEVLNDIDKFWNNWICLLLTKAGNVEYRLLKEAFEYNNYANYYEYIDKISDNHPKLYIDIFNYLVKVNKIKEIINIGNRALLMLDNNLKIRNDIALYLAKYDEDNKEKYIIESFKSNTNVPNLLRIINNGYYLKHKEEINKLICINDNGERYFKIGELTKNTINKSEYYFLKFFTGSFDVFFNECSKVKKPLGWSNSFIQYGVYLLLLYFNKNTNSKVYNSMLSDTFFILGFKNNTLFLDDEYSLIFTKWKENFEITNVEVYLKWLETIIGKRVDAIVSNGHRGSYYKAAILVVALGEVLESNDIQSKVEFIDYYHKKYPRHSSFRRELNENL